MNTIHTVGDLRKALSAYDENLPLAVSCDRAPVHLTTDMQISRVEAENKPATLAIDLFSHQVIYAPTRTGMSAGTVLPQMKEMFWETHAHMLKSSLADQGTEFIKTASLEQIEQHAGDEFAAMSANTKAGILAVVRQQMSAA